MTFRFVHTADLHLDSPLKSLAAKSESLADMVATRETFQRICQLCLDEEAEALIIAGDLYDSNQTSMKTAAFLARELTRLSDAGIRTFIVRGNHDARSRITDQLDLPPAVHMFKSDRRSGAGTETFEARDGRTIAVHGFSFWQEHIEDSLLKYYKPPDPDAFNIGLMHASLDGASGHEPYAPVSRAELFTHGYDYWALGHIHKRNAHETEGRHVVMPGIPQGRHVNEAGTKSVTLVTVTDEGTGTAERVVATTTFERLSISLQDDGDLGDLRKATGAALSAARVEASTPNLIIRLDAVVGRDLSWRLSRQPEAFLEAARAEALPFDGLEIEGAHVALMEPPEAETDGLPLAELSASVKAALSDPMFLEEADALIRELVADSQWPDELKLVFGADEESQAAAIAEFAARGARRVLAYAADGGEDSEQSG